MIQNPNARIALVFVLGALAGGLATFLFVKPKPVVQVLAPQAEPPKVIYEKLTFDDLPGWGNDKLAEVIPALEKSCARIKDDDEPQTLGTLSIAANARKQACAKVLEPKESNRQLRQAFEEAFEPYLVRMGEKSDGLFTGYYEATLNGSLQREGAYQYPLYGLPKNLISLSLKDFVPASALEGSDIPRELKGRIVGQQLKPYFTREEIDLGNVIADESNVIAWIDDPVDVHVLHIQGSGQVTLPNGTVMRVGFAGHNGHVFRGLGRILIDEGVLPQGGASMIAVREWLKSNPKRAQELMAQNARYIFFRKIEGDGPIGASNLALTPQRSMAVDPRFIPMGSLLWLDSVDPDKVLLRRLMVAQDTGAAILGAVRGDYFWGAGEPAFAKAARMRSPGRYFILVPKPNQAPS